MPSNNHKNTPCVGKPIGLHELFQNLNRIGKQHVKERFFGRLKTLSIDPIVWCGNSRDNTEKIIIDCTPSSTALATDEGDNGDRSKDRVNDLMEESSIVEILTSSSVHSEECLEISSVEEVETIVLQPTQIEDVGPIDTSILAQCCHQYPHQSSSYKGFKASEFQKTVLDHCDKVRGILKHKTGLVILATGLGKTILVILDIERELCRLKETEDLKSFKLLFLVHSKVIRDGTFQKFKIHFCSDLESDWDFSESDFLNITENETQKSIDSKMKKAKFVFCLFQSFEKISSIKCSHCVIDEVHHVVAQTYNKVYIALSTLSCIKYMLGMTATLIHRDDPTGEKLKKLFKDVVYVDLPWRLANNLGFFPPVEYLEYLPSTINSSLDILTYQQILKEAFDVYNNPKRQLPNFINKLEKSLIQLGMNTDEQVKKKLTPESVTNVLFQFLHEQVNAGLPPKKKTIIVSCPHHTHTGTCKFVNSCENADQIEVLINKKSKYSSFFELKCSSVHYKKGTKQTKQILEDFESGKINVLVNVMMVSEGYDVKDVDCLVLARQTESEIVFLQQLGRALRRSTNKAVIVIDLALNLRKRWKRLFNDEFQNEEELKRMVTEFWQDQQQVPPLPPRRAMTTFSRQTQQYSDVNSDNLHSSGSTTTTNQVVSTFGNPIEPGNIRSSQYNDGSTINNNENNDELINSDGEGNRKQWTSINRSETNQISDQSPPLPPRVKPKSHSPSLFAKSPPPPIPNRSSNTTSQQPLEENSPASSPLSQKFLNRNPPPPIPTNHTLDNDISSNLKEQKEKVLSKHQDFGINNTGDGHASVDDEQIGSISKKNRPPSIPSRGFGLSSEQYSQNSGSGTTSTPPPLPIRKIVAEKKFQDSPNSVNSVGSNSSSCSSLSDSCNILSYLHSKQNLNMDYIETAEDHDEAEIDEFSFPSNFSYEGENDLSSPQNGLSAKSTEFSVDEALFRRVNSKVKTLALNGISRSSSITRKSSRTLHSSSNQNKPHNTSFVEFQQQHSQSPAVILSDQVDTNNTNNSVILERIGQTMEIETKHKPWSQTDKTLSAAEEELLASSRVSQPHLLQAYTVFNRPFQILKRVPVKYMRAPFHPTFDENDGIDHSHNYFDNSESSSVSSAPKPTSSSDSSDDESSAGNTEEEAIGTPRNRKSYFLKLSEIDKISLGQTEDLDSHIIQQSPRNSVTPRASMRSKTIIGMMGGSSEKRAVDGFDEIQVLEAKKSLVEYAKYGAGKKKTDIIENIEPKNGTVMLVKNPGLDVLTESIQSKTRLMSCLKPDFTFKPLETSMCQRVSDLPYPVKRKTKFFLQCTSLRFENIQMKDRELLFSTVALYDIQYGRKLSEDYHFHLLPNQQLSDLPPLIREELKIFDDSKDIYSSIVVSPKKLFTVSYPNDEVYLVATIYRIPTSNVHEAMKMYLKENKNIEKWSDQYKQLKAKLIRFRQPFLFGFTSLFTKEIIDVKGKQIESFKLESSRYDIKPFYEVDGDHKNPIDFITIIRNSIKEKKIKNNQVQGSMLFTAELLSNSSSQSNYEIQQKIQNSKSRFMSSQSSKSDLDSSFGSPSPSSIIGSSTAFSSPKSINESVISAFDQDGAETYVNQEQLNQVQEFPLLSSNYPNLSLQNTLFIYPQSFIIEGASSAKNIFAEIYFRETDTAPPKVDDSDAKSEKRFISWLKKERTTSLITSLSVDSRQQVLLDELRLELPMYPMEKHHLLFVFYHVDIDNKRSKKLEYASSSFDFRKDFFVTSDRAIIGYAFLPLTKSIQPEECEYTLKHNLVYMPECNEEIVIYKKDRFNSSYLSENILKPLKGSKMKVRTNLVSTIHPRDPILALFYSSLTDLYTASPGKTMEVLDFLECFVLPKFNEIEFSELLPHFPILMNILFELMCRVSELTTDEQQIESLERSVFESLLVCLRGSYHFTKHHTRSNKYFTSYIKFIFENIKGNPLFLNLPRIITRFIHVPEGKETEPAEEGKYIKEMNRLSKKYGKSVIKKTTNLEKDKKEYEKKKNEISPHDPIRFSWFLFDIIIKSIILSGVPSAEDNCVIDYFTEVPEDLFFISLKQLLDNFNKCVNKLMLSDGTGRNNIGLNGNRNLALFIRDLVPILKRGHVTRLVKKYFKFFNGSDEKQLRLKSEFMTILSDYEHWIPLNILSLDAGNFGVKHFSSLFYQIVDGKKDRLIKKMTKVLLNHVCKLDFDSRYIHENSKANVCEIYLVFVDLFFEKDEYLTIFQDDELFVVFSCILLWIMRGLSKQRFISWFKVQPFFKILNILTFLDYITIAINNLDYDPKSKVEDDRSLRTEVSLVVNYLTSIIVSHVTLDGGFIDELEMQSDNIDLLSNMQLADPSLLRQRQLVSYYEAKSLKQQAPLVGLFFRQICRMLMNSVLQLTLRKELELVYVVFRESLLPLVKECTSKLIVNELYDPNIPKKQRTPIAEKRQVEQKWRWLLGAVMLHSGFTSEEEQNAYPIVKECQRLLLEPFNNDFFDVPLDCTDMEEGDLLLNNEEHNIKAGTFRKLVERLLDVDTNKLDRESHKYGEIFLLTCASFTQPINLLTQLIEIFKTAEETVIKLRVEQFISKWVRFGFHDFDNLVIAKLVTFLSNISGVTQKKIKKYIVKHFLNVKMDIYTDVTTVPPNPHIPKNIPKEKLEEPQMDIRKWKEAKKFTKQLDNPFDVKFELLDWPSLEIARQLTIIEAKLFKKIEPKEFFGSAWTDKEYKQELAPTLCAITERTNNVSFWVRNRILMEPNLEVRKKVMKKFVDILRELKELRNYTSIIQITSAFNSAEIHRLKKTKEGLSKQDLELIEECSNLVNNNSKSLREQLEREVIINGAPAVPVVAIYFTDLVFIEDGNADYFEHKINKNKKLINFQKRRLYYNTVNTIKTLQTKSKYILQPLPYLHYVLKEEIVQNIKNDEKTLFDLSLKIEPRAVINK